MKTMCQPDVFKMFKQKILTLEYQLNKSNRLRLRKDNINRNLVLRRKMTSKYNFSHGMTPYLIALISNLIIMALNIIYIVYQYALFH